MKEQKGFTLIELLVVISIISLLASVILSNVNSARGRAQLAAGQQFEANILHGIGDQLIGEWKFDEGSGTAKDTSSFGNNGTVVGATWNSTGGYNGKGTYQFNFGSSFINLAGPAMLNIGKAGTDFTISAWVNYNLTSPNDSTIFFEGDSTGGANANAMIQFSISNDNLLLGFYGPVGIGGITLPHNKWTHVAVTYVSSTKTATFYVNGSIDKAVVTSAAPNFSGFGCAQIGARYCPWSYHTRDFQGMIDSVRVYSARLTAMNIENIYALEKPSHSDTVALK